MTAKTKGRFLKYLETGKRIVRLPQGGSFIRFRRR